MESIDPKLLASNVAVFRKAAGFTQAALARRTGIPRVRIARIETAVYLPSLEETFRLAAVLRVSVEFLVRNRLWPARSLRGIAVELHWMGIRDLEIPDLVPPCSFRTREEVLVLAVMGDRPEPRVVEALPLVLCVNKFRPQLVSGFCDRYDPRAARRLAWLRDVTASLARRKGFPFEIRDEDSLGWAAFQSGARSQVDEPDSLGHPGEGPLPPLWRRWNVTYAGTPDDFLWRVAEAATAYHATGGLDE